MQRFILPVLFIAIIISLSNTDLNAQDITGRVVDATNNLPLAWVNIGVVGLPAGTVSNEAGEFTLRTAGLPEDAEIRVSMIGYSTRSYSLRELNNGEAVILLERNSIPLQEVTVHWKNSYRTIGNENYTHAGGVCGWGGTDFGKGHEIGLLLDLGEEPVLLQEINLKVYKQSFDTAVFRLHLRSLEDGKPGTELLTKNIYLALSSGGGWEKAALSDYGIMAKGKVVLSIEWIRISGVNPKKLVRMNKDKDPSAVILFNINKKDGTIFIRRGSEAPWKIQAGYSPAFYLTVKE